MECPKVNLQQNTKREDVALMICSAHGLDIKLHGFLQKHVSNSVKSN